MFIPSICSSVTINRAFCKWEYGRAECEGLVSTFVFVASTCVLATTFNVTAQRELIQLSCSYLVLARS